eukprot:482875_1
MSATPSEVTNIEVLVSRYMRNQCEIHVDNAQVEPALNQLIQSFTEPVIGSKLLSLNEDTNLVKLLFSNNLSFNNITLMYESKASDFNNKIFRNKCQKKK